MLTIFQMTYWGVDLVIIVSYDLFQYPVSALLPPCTIIIYGTISARLSFSKYSTSKADQRAQGKARKSKYFDVFLMNIAWVKKIIFLL